MSILFDGNARVYLQGQGALLPFGTWSPEQMCYFIGDSYTNLIVKDRYEIIISTTKKK